MALTPEQKRMMTKLNELDGAVKWGTDPFAYGIEMPSPSIGFVLDNTWLLPQGASILFGGMPKSGKTILVSAIEGLLQQQDEDAVILHFNTEMREQMQVTPQQKKLWGIDDSRRIVYEVREPALIFDRIEQEVPKLVQAGIKVRLVVIDSISDIIGRRTMNADSVDQQQIADKAATLQDGLSRIKGPLHRNGVSAIYTTQVRTELDQLEQRRGNKVRMAVSWAVKHSCEYFVSVENYRCKDGKTDLTGKGFEDESVKGMDGEADTSAHKLRITCNDNSLGRAGRVAMITLDHELGIIHKNEEVFLLGVGMNVIDNQKQGYFGFGDRNWHGKDAMLQAIKDEPELYSNILKGCKAIDAARRGR